MHDRQPALRRFADPAGLLDYMHGAGGEPEARNAVLAALVREAQSDAPEADSAAVLIALALWPGLDAVYRRRLRHYRQNPSALSSGIALRLVTMVREMDLDRVHRIAATVTRNINRDIGRELQACWQRDQHRVDITALETEDPDPDWSGAADIAPKTAREQAANLTEALQGVIGRDARLITDIVVLGLTQQEAAHRHGITHEAARKRYQRAMARLRGHLADGAIDRER